MIKKLLVVFIICIQFSNAQVVSINPNYAVQGQHLTTTITVASGLISMASPPYYQDDVYLQYGASYNIYATNFNYYYGGPTGLLDSIDATFDIPLVAPLGLYDVHVITYTSDPTLFGIPVNNYLLNGFTVTQSTVGIQQKQLLQNNFVYPNPVSGQSILFIKDQAITSIEVFDMAGRKIFQNEIKGNYIIDNEILETGLYLYLLKDKNGLLIDKGKFIIDK